MSPVLDYVLFNGLGRSQEVDYDAIVFSNEKSAHIFFSFFNRFTPGISNNAPWSIL
jgi:hypothetical protein